MPSRWTHPRLRCRFGKRLVTVLTEFCFGLVVLVAFLALFGHGSLRVINIRQTQGYVLVGAFLTIPAFLYSVSSLRNQALGEADFYCSQEQFYHFDLLPCSLVYSPQHLAQVLGLEDEQMRLSLPHLWQPLSLLLLPDAVSALSVRCSLAVRS